MAMSVARSIHPSERKPELTVLLHNVEEFDGDLGGGSDEDLALAHAVGIVDGVHRIRQNACSNHDGGGWGGSTSTWTCEMVARRVTVIRIMRALPWEIGDVPGRRGWRARAVGVDECEAELLVGGSSFFGCLSAQVQYFFG